MSIIPSKMTKKVSTVLRTMAFSSLIVVSACSKEPLSQTVARGNDAMRSGDYKTAVKAFRRAAKRDKDSPELFYNLGMAEYKTGSYSRAAKSLTRSGELTKDGSFAAWEALAAVRIAQGKKDAAIAAYETAIISAGRTPIILAGMAAVELKNQKPDAALALISEALAQTMTEPVVLYNMACVLRDGFNDLPASKAYFLRFLEYNPPANSIQADKAEKALETMTNIEPATSKRAMELIEKSSLEESPATALISAEEAVRIDPWSPDAIWTCANVALNAGNKERCMKLLSFFQTNFPADPRVARISGGTVSRPARNDYADAKKAVIDGRTKDAAASYKRAVAGAEKNNVMAWIEYSDVLLGLGDNRAALNASQEAVKLAPKNPDALYRVGYFHLLLGESEKAKSAWKKYLPLAPASAQKDWVNSWVRKN